MSLRSPRRSSTQPVCRVVYISRLMGSLVVVAVVVVVLVVVVFWHCVGVYVF